MRTDNYIRIVSMMGSSALKRVSFRLGTDFIGKCKNVVPHPPVSIIGIFLL
jgi:hypothetical protein